MKATAICRRLFALLQEEPRAGTVHSVFDHAVNLAMESREGLVGLIAQNKALTPYAVLAQTSHPFTQTGVRAGMAVAICGGLLEIPQAGIRLDLSAARRIELCVDAIGILSGGISRESHIAYLLSLLQAAAAETSLAPLATGVGANHYSNFLAPRFHSLEEAIRAEDGAAAAQVAGRFAGCGMGLTPSSDDLLCGYLATLRLLAREQNRVKQFEILTQAAIAAAAKTNRISATFLLQSGEGLVNLSVYELLTSIFSNEAVEVTRAAAKGVLVIGSTSGADILTGVILALRQ